MPKIVYKTKKLIIPKELEEVFELKYVQIVVEKRNEHLFVVRIRGMDEGKNFSRFDKSGFSNKEDAIKNADELLKKYQVMIDSEMNPEVFSEILRFEVDESKQEKVCYAVQEWRGTIILRKYVNRIATTDIWFFESKQQAENFIKQLYL